MNFAVKPEKGSERVKAWTYAILNPLIDTLRREAAQLKVGNLSWRLHSKRCEYLRPVEETIDPSHLPILEDLLAEDPSFRERFAERDLAIVKLGEAAAAFFRSLLQSDLFKNDVAQCLHQYQTTIGPNEADLADIAAKVPEYVAENLVNNITSVPRHHTMHLFWQRFGPEFSNYRNRETFSVTEAACVNLLGISERLRVDLESLRLSLCRDYDIPAAPLDPIRSFPENPAPRPRW
jgi:hypothetical protein